MAVLFGLNGGSAQDVIIAILTAFLLLEQAICQYLTGIKKFGNIDAFWSLVEKDTGFTPDKPLSDLAAHILITALSQTLPEYLPATLNNIGLENF
jgi:hypothetical protein